MFSNLNGFEKIVCILKIMLLKVVGKVQCWRYLQNIIPQSCHICNRIFQCSSCLFLISFGRQKYIRWIACSYLYKELCYNWTQKQKAWKSSICPLMISTVYQCILCLLQSSDLVSCQYDPGHRVPRDSLIKHEERCYLKKHKLTQEDIVSTMLMVSYHKEYTDELFLC